MVRVCTVSTDKYGDAVQRCPPLSCHLLQMSSTHGSIRGLGSKSRVHTGTCKGRLDAAHNHAIAETAHRMIAGSELYDLFPGDLDVDLVPTEDWVPLEAEMAGAFVDFLSRAQAKAA